MTMYPVPVTEVLLEEITQRIVENFDPEQGTVLYERQS